MTLQGIILSVILISIMLMFLKWYIIDSTFDDMKDDKRTNFVKLNPLSYYHNYNARGEMISSLEFYFKNRDEFNKFTKEQQLAFFTDDELEVLRIWEYNLDKRKEDRKPYPPLQLDIFYNHLNDIRYILDEYERNTIEMLRRIK